MKAIQITARNQAQLGSLYGLDGYEEEFPVGHYIVADFGTHQDEHYEGVFSPAELQAQFIQLRPLENHWIEVEKR